MARAAIFLAIALFGTPLGYFARAAHETPPNRADSMVRLFETYCLPHALNAKPPSMDALVRLGGVASVNQWADQRSKIMIESSRHKCLVSDALHLLDQADHEKVDMALPLMLARAIPSLKSQPAHNPFDFDRFDSWSQYPANTASYRKGPVVRLYRYQQFGTDSQTEIHLYIP